jgi:hypothetical protein
MREQEMAEQGHWMETAGYAASDPGRVAVIVVLAQVGQALDEMTLAQQAGLIYQNIVGQPLETAALIHHIRDLEGRGVTTRDASGFRWTLTPLGQLVSRPWASGVEPTGSEPLDAAGIRARRDRIVAQLDADAQLAEQANIAPEELIAGLSVRLAELRVLNRILADEALPNWLRELAGRE